MKSGKLPQEDMSTWGSDPSEVERPWTQVHDWILFIPISPQARHLYLLLRSLLYDGKDDPRNNTRELSDRELCRLLALGLDKAPSRSSLWRWKDELARSELIVLAGDHKVSSSGYGGITSTASRKYYVRRYPESGVRVWSSALQILKHMDEKEDNPPAFDPPGIGVSWMEHRNDLRERQDALKSTRVVVSPVTHGVSKMKQPGASDQDFSASKNLPKESSSSSTSSAVAPPSPAPVRSAAPPGMMEEEQAIPSGDEGAQEQESPQDDLTPRELTVTPEDQRMALRLLGAVPWPAKASVGLKAKRVLVERLSVLAAGGWTEEIVREYITARVPDWKKVARPTNLVVHLLDDAPERVGEAFMESSVDEPQVLVSARRTLAGLERQLAVQKSHIKGCATCDDAGMVWSGGARWEGDAVWHKHGSMTLSNECRKAGFEVARIAESLDTDHAKGWEFTPQEVPADA